MHDDKKKPDCSFTLTSTDMASIDIFDKVLEIRASNTEYWNTVVNVGGIDTGIVLSNTVVFSIGNSGSQQRHALCNFV